MGTATQSVAVEPNPDMTEISEIERLKLRYGIYAIIACALQTIAIVLNEIAPSSPVTKQSRS
jgi:hypothetical protein